VYDRESARSLVFRSTTIIALATKYKVVVLRDPDAAGYRVPNSCVVLFLPIGGRVATA
jgi:hypothetical protein